MTSYQFLRAKDFVRALSETEMAELRQHIRQVNCGNCGAPVDIERDAICGFCRTPVAIVDPDQVRKVLEQQRRTRAGRAAPSGRLDPTLPHHAGAGAAAGRARVGRHARRVAPATVLDLFFGNATDPIAGGLRVLSRLLGGSLKMRLEMRNWVRPHLLAAVLMVPGIALAAGDGLRRPCASSGRPGRRRTVRPCSRSRAR